ncbi:MAG TPA: type II toxin-antitoxin system PrlF family antitoxin [Longimicrobium sp.]
MEFEEALFRAHPEFASGPLAADYIGPGHLLVRAVAERDESGPEDDPVVGAYLAFLEREMTAHPDQIQPLSTQSLARAEALVGHLDVDPEEDLGEEVSID